MHPALPLLAGLLAGDIPESDRQALERVERERQELAAYDECRDARQSTTVWKVGVRDAWLRAGADPDSPTTGVLHRGQAVTLLKVDRTSTLVKVDGDRKGFLWNDELVKVVHPPRDPRPVEDCPQPALYGQARTLEFRGDPGPEDLEALEVEDPQAPGDAADTGAGRPR